MIGGNPASGIGTSVSGPFLQNGSNEWIHFATPTAPGSYLYELEVNGSITDQISVTVSEAPIPQIFYPVGSCINSPLNLTGGCTGSCTLASYQWDSPSTGSGISGTLNGQNISPIPTSSGTKTYNLTITNSTGCTATASETVEIYELPNLSYLATPPTSICLGENIGMTLGCTGGCSNLNYSWSATGGNPSGLISTTGISQNITPTAANTYTYSVTATNTGGCNDTRSHSVTVQDTPIVTLTMH